MARRGRHKKPDNRDIRGVPFRVNLTAEQRHSMRIYLGHCRFLWNYLLGLKEVAWQELEKSYTRRMCQDLLPWLKQEYPWLSQVHSQVLQDVNFRLFQAYENFFQGRARKPRFKSKRSPQGKSFTFPQNSVGNYQTIVIDWEAGSIKLPGFGEIKAILHRNDPQFRQAKILSATVREKNGRYFVTIAFDVGECTPMASTVMEGQVRAGDLGLKDLLICSHGKRFENPKPFQANLKRLRSLQKRLDRLLRRHNSQNYQPDYTVCTDDGERVFRRKGKVKPGRHNWHYSRNASRLKRQIAQLHETIANQRRDHHFKIAAELVDESQAVGLETLRIKNMVKLKTLARHIHDSGWGQLCRIVKNLCRREGKPFIGHDPFLPSSQRCGTPGCNHQNRELKLKDRAWTCPACGVTHDRDDNAASVLYYETLLRLRAQGICVLRGLEAPPVAEAP